MPSTALATAEAAHQRGDLQLARQWYQRALREEADNPYALYGLGTLNQDLPDFIVLNSAFYRVR